MIISVFFRNLIKAPLGLFFSKLSFTRRSIQNGITIFVYHEVTDSPSLFSSEYGLAVSTDIFKKQIEWIDRNFTIIHPEQLTQNTKLPESAALITFDDGMISSFKPGLEILEKMNLPSLFFLNMGSVIEKKPLVSAIACYLGKQSSEFKKFCADNKIAPPYHLTIQPQSYKRFISETGFMANEAINNYQGEFAEMDLVEEWSLSKNVVYANHLYEHWNAEALTDKEFCEQYMLNEQNLVRFKNFMRFFAFPNGQPGTCFKERHIDLLKQLGAVRIFSSSGHINIDCNSYLLDRIALGRYDKTNATIWFKVGLAYFKKQFRKILSR